MQSMTIDGCKYMDNTISYPPRRLIYVKATWFSYSMCYNATVHILNF